MCVPTIQATSRRSWTFDVLVHDDDRLREHQLAEAPDGVHDFARVARIALVDRDDDEVVEDALGRKVHVDDLGVRLLDHRQEDPLARHAEVVVLHRRDADDGRQIRRPLAARDAREMEHRIVVRLRIEARVIAERALRGAARRARRSLRARCARWRALRDRRSRT